MNKVTVVPGDGIGPEVVGATCAIIKASGAKVEFEEALVGLRAEKEFGTPLPVSVLESIERNKLALKGPTQTPFGGNYRITENLGVPAAGIRRLNNTYLDITEIRVGVGADYKVTEALNLEVDLGVTTLRRFDYPDRDYRLKGDNVGWLKISLNSRF